MSRPLLRELGIFAIAVTVGSLVGVALTITLRHRLGSETVGNLALAVATTCAAATHARFAHSQSLRTLVPRIAVGGPVAYGVMRLVHAIVGS